jgi:enamine deaminase RidA (YjgF/YER057c/UK114 family)
MRDVVTLWPPYAISDQVVKLTIHLTNVVDLDVFRQVRDEYISLEKPPASWLVRASGLVDPAFRIEVDALAVV